MPDGGCTHLRAITTVKYPKRRVCEDCVKIGASWVHLRTCQNSGTTLCCDSSPNRHASRHAHASGHPVSASTEPGDRWLYCYPEDAFAEYERSHGDRLMTKRLAGKAALVSGGSRCIGLRPEVLAGAVLFRAMVPLVPETMPHLRGRPVFLAAGRRDPIVSPDETERLRRLLSQAGADVTVHWAKAAHGLTPADIEAARAWLQDWATARRDRAPANAGIPRGSAA